MPTTTVAMLTVRNGEYDQAIADYTIEPPTYGSLQITGHRLRRQSRSMTKPEYTKALQLNPDNADAYWICGLAYANKGEDDLAIDDYTKALQLNPDLAAAYYSRGFAYDDKGKYDLAIADYTKALELNPNYADAYHSRGLVLRRQKGI